MIWLASYPRSGNTYFRILLHEVYGLRSAEYSLNAPSWWPQDYQNYPVVKTHELPEALKPDDPEIPAVYLVRDGRDAIVSTARQRSTLVAPGSCYRTNLKAVIRAQKGSYFGGWSRHVRLWRRRASIIIRFEDLIQHPVETVERIRPWIQLPAPQLEKIPTFDHLKSQEYRFNERPNQSASPEFRRAFFRRGKVGAWKDELPRWLLWLFYYHHGRMLRRMGYENRNWLRLAFGPR